jgi:hypothetical protein
VCCRNAIMGLRVGRASFRATQAHIRALQTLLHVGQTRLPGPQTRRTEDATSCPDATVSLNARTTRHCVATTVHCAAIVPCSDKRTHFSLLVRLVESDVACPPIMRVPGSMRGVIVGGTLGLASIGVCELAEARPSSRLVYTRGGGAEKCPDDDGLRSAVSMRLGYDPFREVDPTRVEADIVASPPGCADAFGTTMPKARCAGSASCAPRHAIARSLRQPWP